MTYVIFKTCLEYSSVSSTRGSRVSSCVGALVNLATRLETKNVRQNVTQTFTQDESQYLGFFSEKVGSPGETHAHAHIYHSFPFLQNSLSSSDRLGPRECRRNHTFSISTLCLIQNIEMNATNIISNFVSVVKHGWLQVFYMCL